MVEFGQTTLAGAALKFRSWQSSLQVRKDTSSGIRHFSQCACVTLPGQQGSETRDICVNHKRIIEWSFILP